MSILTEVVVIVDHEPDRDVEQRLTSVDFGEGQRLNRLSTDAAGGGKVFCGAIYAACFNYVSTERVREALAGFDWGHSEATIYVRNENDGAPLVLQPLAD